MLDRRTAQSPLAYSAVQARADYPWLGFLRPTFASDLSVPESESCYVMPMGIDFVKDLWFSGRGYVVYTDQLAKCSNEVWFR